MSHTPACWASFVSPTYEMGANANERGIRKSEVRMIPAGWAGSVAKDFPRAADKTNGNRSCHATGNSLPSNRSQVCGLSETSCSQK